MSEKGWIYISVVVDEDEEFTDEVIRWMGEHGFRASNAIGVYEAVQEGEAYWLDTETGELANVLKDLHVPVNRWHAYVHYESYEGVNEDGCIAEYNIVGGKLCNYKESRIEMVDADPSWLKFDMEEE